MKNNSTCFCSFILGLISIFIPIVVLPILSIIFGIIGILSFNSKKEAGRGYGVAGLILGILYLGSWIYQYSQYR